MPTTPNVLENPLCFVCQRIHLLPLIALAFLSSTSSQIKKKNLGRVNYQQSNLLIYQRINKEPIHSGHRTTMKIMCIVLFRSLLLSLQSEYSALCQRHMESYACKWDQRCVKAVSAG